MSVTANHINIIASYFKAWKEYDVALISTIFAAEASYEIIPRNRILKGSGEICEYWKRNQKRQRDIFISWDILQEKEDLVSVSFRARFYDVEEKEQQQIVGDINFIFNNNIIQHLSERYDKMSG